MQGAVSFHDYDFSLADESAFHGLAHKSFSSPHPPIAQRIRSGIAILLSYALTMVQRSM